MQSQSGSDDLDNTQISVLTCRSGDELYSTFGHTSIRIFNPQKGLDYVYNYGIFSFNTSGFYLKFMRGQLPYYVAAYSMENFLKEYHYDKRSVFEQVLILEREEKEKMITFLANNAKPENREYKYDFFHDNCSTRVVDIYSMGGNVNYTNPLEEKTFRDLIKENLQNLVWSEFGIDLIIGARADRIADRRGQMFLPEYVMANLEAAERDNGQKLAMAPQLILDFEELNVQRKTQATNWPLICTFLLFILTLAINWFKVKFSNVYNKFLLTLAGIMGLFMLFMWFGTDHGATRDNWNVLWMNPLILLYAGLSMSNPWKRKIAILMMILLVISALNCLVTFLPQFYHLAFLPIILSVLAIIYFENFRKADTRNRIIVTN